MLGLLVTFLFNLTFNENSNLAESSANSSGLRMGNQVMPVSGIDLGYKRA